MKDRKPMPKNVEHSPKCKECGEIISKSITTSREASDYAANFCGLDCYDHWKKAKKANKSLYETSS